VRTANREPRIARRVLALLCLLAILAIRLEPRLMRLPFMDRKPISEMLTQYPDAGWQPYPRFLEGVRARTRSGDSIAVIVPKMKWDDGYSYAYYRATYFLTGRTVLPLVTADDRPHPENFRDARYIAVWRTHLPPGPQTVVWSGHGGVLLRH
jgi:hypothetical protein